ncbi:MAG: HD domain-containing phosphohydrolase [Actinomycetes bacterium]
MSGVLAALSVTSDLTRGHPPGEAMRACLVASDLGRRAGLSAGSLGDIYYGTLLRFAGCAATSHEMAAALGGDDIVVRARGDLTDAARPAESMRLLAGLGQGVEKLRILGRAPGVPRLVVAGARADCEVGADLTRRLRLPETVRLAVLDAFERFDGRGAPAGRAGEDVAEAARFAAVGYCAVMFDAVGGADVARETVARWSGRALDPAVATVFLESPDELLQLSDPEDLWQAVVDAEPVPRRVFRDDAALDEALAGFGDAADLKTPWFHGHSRGVAGLAGRAAAHLGSADPAVVRRAGFVHDLGRVAVPTGVWELPRTLRPEERELVRLHPYHSGRILARSPVLAPLGLVASRHHERTDGSGYPAGVTGGELDQAARLLAAADVLHALGEPRPYRPALEPGEASRVLSALPPLPAALTERELDVLRRLVTGRTKREIAAELIISPSTVHTHTVHIYGKCGVTSRAGLAMFAMQHGLAGARAADSRAG